jgi:hypothetical protein
MKIILKPDEVTVCQMIGRMRSLIARSSGVKDAKMGDQDGAEADVIGMMAEYAFAKQFNVFPDMGLSPRSGSADGVVKGKRYDIKATTYKTGKLLCTVKDNPDVDVYILAIVSNNEVDVIGWEYKENLRKEENLIDLGHGKGYALTQDKLQKF